MARFITVTVGCDWPDCDVVAPESDDLVAPKTVSIDGKQAREFLLCKPHLDEFDAVVHPLMAAGLKTETSVGSKKTQRSTSKLTETSTTEPIFCQVPGCERAERPLASRTGLAQHVLRTHGYESTAAYDAEFPPVAVT